MNQHHFCHVCTQPIMLLIAILAWLLITSQPATLFAQSSQATATTWHVDAVNGSDQHNGKTPATAFAHIQTAVDLAQPGDTVLIHPGVYPELLKLKRPGTKDAPIRIMADQVEKDRVIITAADLSIRNKQRSWECVDTEMGLYRIALDHRPVRVLAERVDLLPYPSLNDLKAFRFLKTDYPGNVHGFAWDKDEQMLYVRLRSDCKYNPSTNPNELLMCVAPPTGGGRYGHIANREDNYNINIPVHESGWIIIEGITFETPGVAAVFTQAHDVTVRNCWFYGCRAAVAAPEDYDIATHADRVTIENCYYTQFPTFSDAMEIIERTGEAQYQRKEYYHKLMHWQRKGNFPPGDGVGDAYGYEVGLTICMGKGWIIRNNHCFEVVDGISAAGNRFSQDATISGNRFERLCDNAVEAEQHASNLVIASNLIIDTFEPFSWQPQASAPLPGPVYIHDNVVLQSSDNVRLWELAHYWPGIFKVGNKDRHWIKLLKKPQPVTIPGGMWFTHNTFITPRCRLLTYLNTQAWPMDNVHFLNNIMCLWRLIPPSQATFVDHMVFDYNRVWPATPVSENKVDTNLSRAAGEHGVWSDKSYIPDDWQSAMTGQDNAPAGLTTRDTFIVPQVTPLRSQIGAASLTLTVGPQSRQ